MGLGTRLELVILLHINKLCSHYDIMHSRANSDLSERSLELEVELSRLKEQSIDHHSLLATMAQDKETLSRYNSCAFLHV